MSKELLSQIRSLKSENRRLQKALKDIRDADYSFERGICSDLHEIASEVLERRPLAKTKKVPVTETRKEKRCSL